jgi:DNA (cytosine-5)-methyltransferase 1
MRGTEFGLSPNGVDSFHTPNTTGLDGGSNSRKALKKRQMLPTPTATTAKQGALSMSGLGKPLLHMAALMWPTPAATDYKGSGKNGKTRDRLDYATERGTTKSKTYGIPTGTGQLNPTWVEWLMGWPLGFTDLKPLEMDKSHFAPQPPGTF